MPIARRSSQAKATGSATAASNQVCRRGACNHTVAAIATLTVTATAFAARLAATRTGYGALALRGIEVAASIVVLFFGLALLAGYMASERLIGV